MTTPALRIVKDAPFTDVSNEGDVAEAILDQQLTNLEQMAGSARWPETLAVQVGQLLSHAQGDMEDRHRRARTAMMQEARALTVRLARFTGALMTQYGVAWYEVAVSRGMVALEKQTLYNARQILRVDAELRDAYDVWPSELIAASSVPSKAGQAALLAHAALEGVGARQVATLAKAMREQGLDDVPVLPATGRTDDMPDAPDALSELWLHYTNLARATRAKLQELGMSQDDAYAFVRAYEEDAQRAIRGRK